MRDMVPDKYVYKIILFGDSDVGKSTLLHRLTSGEFNDKTPKTIGVEFRSKLIHVDNIGITLQIWDFSGEERFNFLFSMYLRGTDGGIFMFNMSDFQSILSLNEWIYRARQYTGNDFPILFLGGKTDLVDDDKDDPESINYIPGLNLDKKHDKSSDLFWCSAKTGDNVDAIFQAIAEKIYYQNKMKQTIIDRTCYF